MQCSGVFLVHSARNWYNRPRRSKETGRHTVRANQRRNWGTQESSPQGAPSNCHGQPVTGPKVQSGCLAKLAPKGTRVVRESASTTS